MAQGPQAGPQTEIFGLLHILSFKKYFGLSIEIVLLNALLI